MNSSVYHASLPPPPLPPSPCPHPHPMASPDTLSGHPRKIGEGKGTPEGLRTMAAEGMARSWAATIALARSSLYFAPRSSQIKHNPEQQVVP